MSGHAEKPADKPVGESLGWKPRRSSYPFSSRWFRLRSDAVEMPGAESEGLYSYVEHPGSVMVVPVLADGRVVLIRSYRYPLDAWCWEIVGGQVEPGAIPEDTARAELDEELGATCDAIEPLLDTFVANGFARCRTRYFLARGVSMTGEQRLEVGETIARAEPVPLDEAIERVGSPGQDGDSMLGLLLAARALSEGAAP
ncbi:MAG: NUDIX hydrolase [Planctomycetota bacterium]